MDDYLRSRWKLFFPFENKAKFTMVRQKEIKKWVIVEC